MKIEGFVSRGLAEQRVKELERDIRRARSTLFHEDEAIEQANEKKLEALLGIYRKLKGQLRNNKDRLVIEI